MNTELNRVAPILRLLVTDEISKIVRSELFNDALEETIFHALLDMNFPLTVNVARASDVRTADRLDNVRMLTATAHPAVTFNFWRSLRVTIATVRTCADLPEIRLAVVVRSGDFDAVVMHPEPAATLHIRKIGPRPKTDLLQ
jgi:hypothetical protein